METTSFPTLDEALELHQVLIERYGGSLGVRDCGLLESALIRPQTGYYETLSAQAAALLQSLACNHPFVDGNKRVAFALSAIFLRLNGYRLVVSADTAEAFVIDAVIQGHASIDTISGWLEEHMQAASSI